MSLMKQDITVNQTQNIINIYILHYNFFPESKNSSSKSFTSNMLCG